MALEPGQAVPNVTLKQKTPEGIKDVATAERFKGKRAIIFGVSSAYTPMGSTKLLPGYIERADRLKAKSIDEIACVSVNDRFVMSPRAETYDATGELLMLCDPKAELTPALDLDLDLYGLGQRSQRYSISGREQRRKESPRREEHFRS